MTRVTFRIRCSFSKPLSLGYIASPYTPEMCRYIDILKQSGMNRAKSEANRRKALEEHLRGIGMTLAEFDELKAKTQEPFYRDDRAEIIIPEKHVYGFLVSTTDTVRAASKPCPADQVHSRISASAWTTGKTEADGVWERFVGVKSGTGAKLSNQRALRSDPYIVNFTAEGTLSLDPTAVRPETLEAAIRLGADMVGIGASRKMGWGRFVLDSFEKE